MAPVVTKSSVACVINRIEALNIIYVNGAFGEVEFLQITGTMFSRNTTVSKHPVLQDLIVLQDFNVGVVKEPNQIFLSILKLKPH